MQSPACTGDCMQRVSKFGTTFLEPCLSQVGLKLVVLLFGSRLNDV